MTREADDSRGKNERRALFSRLWRNRRGSASVEFTMLALPFLLLLFATLENCVSFAAQEVLANATDNVARMMRTGQIKPVDVNNKPAALKQLICDRITVVFPTGCPGLEVELKQYPTFEAAAAVRVKYTGTGASRDLDTTGFNDITLGPSMSKNMLRVFYRWPVITDLMAAQMANLKDKKALHFSTVTWQNEPFDD